MQTYSVFDFTKGLDLKTSALKLALLRGQNALRKADNIVYSAAGAASKRLDRTTLTSVGAGASVTVSGGCEFVRSNGSREVIFGTDDGKIYKLNGDGTITSQVTGLTTGTRFYFATYNDLLIVCNRADAPRKYDGTTWGTLGGSPPTTGGPVVVHGNRVFFLDATSTSQLSWSALNNEEDYTTASNAGSVLINDQDGHACVGLVPGINELIILKDNRPYRLQGTSPSTFALTNVVPTTGSVGAASYQSNVFAANDVWYLSRSGIANLRTVLDFGDLKESFGSSAISPYFEPGSDFTLALQNLDKSCGAYDAQSNRLYFAVDNSSDGQNDMMLVLDLKTRGWSVWTSQPIASMWPVLNTSTGLSEIYAGGYDGHIRALNRDVSTNAIDGHVKHLSCLNAPGIEKSVRYVYLYLKEEGNFSVTATLNYDFGATGGQTYSASLLGGSKTLGVNWTLGEDPLGAKQQIVKRLDVSGTGEFLEVGVRNQSAGQPFTLYGLEAMYRPRRTVRRGTAS